MFRLFTFNSDQRGAALFFRRAVLFLAVPMAIGIAYEAAIFRTGESWPVSRVVKVQDKLDDFLYCGVGIEISGTDTIVRGNSGKLIHSGSLCQTVNSFLITQVVLNPQHQGDCTCHMWGGLTRTILA